MAEIIQIVDGWNMVNVPANQGTVALKRGFGNEVAVYYPIHDGSITAVAVRTNKTRTGGSLSVNAHKNGLPLSGATATLDATNPTTKTTNFNKNVHTFVTGDSLVLVVATDSAWAPNDAEIRGAIELTMG